MLIFSLLPIKIDRKWFGLRYDDNEQDRFFISKWAWEELNLRHAYGRSNQPSYKFNSSIKELSKFSISDFFIGQPSDVFK